MTPQDATKKQTDEPWCVCTACGEAVIVYGGNYFRTCEHEDEGAPFVLTYSGLKELARGVS
jgi:hypothetical protein